MFNVNVVKTFRKLLKIFIEIFMLIHFDSKNKIRIETNVFEFVIATILSQLTQRMRDEEDFVWHSVIFYFWKMISAKTRYETHDQEFLFIIIAFQQWKHYLKSNRYLIEILTNHNNLWYFMITIILNRRQTRWFLILVKYDFEIKYRVKKINFVDESSRRSNYESEIDDEFCLLILQNKLKNIFVVAIELYFVVTRDVARTHESRSKNVVISSRVKEIKNDSSKLFLEENKFDQQNNVVMQQLRRANVDAICEKKASFEKSFKMLLAKIEKFQKKNSMIIRMRAQLKSFIERKICANRKWSVNKKNFLQYFHAVYVFEKAFFRFALLRFHHDDSLTKHYEKKKILILLKRKFYWQRIRANINAYV